MKIFVPVEGEDIKDSVNSHVGKARHFVFFDTENDTWEIIDNEFIYLEHPCEFVSKKAIDLKADAVIVRYICPLAFKILKEANIKVFIVEKETVKEAIDSMKKNQLAQVFKPNKKH